MMSNTKRRLVSTTDTEIDVAIAQAKSYDAVRPCATKVKYRVSGDDFEIYLANGVALIIPRRVLQGLENAKPAQLRNVEVVDFGSILHWGDLDVDHYVPGLLETIFGTKKWMSHIGKKGGSARSAVKATAVRKNGLMGGRPRKAADSARYRDEESHSRYKSGSASLKSLRKKYGQQFGAGFRSDMKLDTLLDRTGTKSLSDFLRKSMSSLRKK